jgi:hypothetical protein
VDATGIGRVRVAIIADATSAVTEINELNNVASRQYGAPLMILRGPIAIYLAEVRCRCAPTVLVS